MEIQRGHLYVIDFNPRVRTKPGKLRPAVVLQSDMVNEAGYPSTIVIPTTTRLVENPGILRLRMRRGEGGLARESDLLLGQLIAVANESFRQEIGISPDHLMEELEKRVRIILGL
ncbi:MAG: type II toxin-antitoxin system PemK/MazF family toxin [Acidobacteria bacterium]|nr:type II toxin-antitoxin system PemK/MazF family toxin [Acidobacteriota bacterium]